MDISVYLSDPCRASSLPFWKTETVVIPENIMIVRDDKFSSLHNGHDEPYFKLMHDLKTIPKPRLPEGYEIIKCSIDEFAQHINSCYTHEHLTIEELMTYELHPVYQPELWVAVVESKSGRIVATGIGELDDRIGEGILEWIQVSLDCRRKGLGAFVVCEILQRMRNKACFVTVSGRMTNESNPLALYRTCGFTNPVIWHIVSS